MAFLSKFSVIGLCREHCLQYLVPENLGLNFWLCSLCRYGVPASNADALEAVARSKVYAGVSGKPRKDAPAGPATEAGAADDTLRALLGKTSMFCPKLLLDEGVSGIAIAAHTVQRFSCPFLTGNCTPFWLLRTGFMD